MQGGTRYAQPNANSVEMYSQIGAGEHDQKPDEREISHDALLDDRPSSPRRKRRKEADIEKSEGHRRGVSDGPGTDPPGHPQAKQQGESGPTQWRHARPVRHGRQQEARERGCNESENHFMRMPQHGWKDWQEVEMTCPNEDPTDCSPSCIER
jgi:hypothetical protein